jgi:hypothetical protein
MIIPSRSIVRRERAEINRNAKRHSSYAAGASAPGGALRRNQRLHSRFSHTTSNCAALKIDE